MKISVMIIKELLRGFREKIFTRLDFIHVMSSGLFTFLSSFLSIG